MSWPANPLGGEPPTGEPYAGEPHVRFGGGRGRATGPAYSYQKVSGLGTDSSFRVDTRPRDEAQILLPDLRCVVVVEERQEHVAFALCHGHGLVQQ